MTNIRRYFRPNDISFLTHVTQDRAPILVDHFDLWESAVRTIRERNHFELLAWVVLPDHCHLLIDPSENDISAVMRRIKLSFSSAYRLRVGAYRKRVWQHRFWDHIIRDEDDLRRHFDYIHYNPVKHGFVTSACRWMYSSFAEWMKNAYYAEDWGVVEPPGIDGEFGE